MNRAKGALKGHYWGTLGTTHTAPIPANAFLKPLRPLPYIEQRRRKRRACPLLTSGTREPYPI